MDVRVALDVLGLIGTVATAGAAAVTAFQVVGGCVDQKTRLEIPVGLLQGGFVVIKRAFGRHKVPAIHLASTMMAEPIKMKIPPSTTGICSWPLKSSTENKATKSG